MYLHQFLTTGLLASVLPSVFSFAISNPSKIRTVVTTDMEQDDLASLVRYFLYANEIDNQGFIYTSSRYHWEGDGNGTEFFLPDREYNTSQTSWRPVGTTTIEKYLLQAYAEVLPNLRQHDPSYPSQEHLLSITKVGNVDFEGEMAKDTDGSNHIKELVLDNDPRTLYLQAWGGTNTIARALKSIEDEYSSSHKWNQTKAHISRKVVLLASGFQDNTYEDYIAPNWPDIRTEKLDAGYQLWAFNCNEGQGNTRGLPDNNIYFQGSWIKPNIQVGPLGSLYRSWLDGQTTPGGGDQLDVFGDPAKANTSWCQPQKQYDFLSEGDNVAYLGLIPAGLQDPSNPKLGSWGGRLKHLSTSPDLWSLVDKEIASNGSQVGNWSTNRWIAPIQNDFAARMQWTLTPEYSEANHPPSVKILGPKMVHAHLGEVVRLSAHVSDPDGNKVDLSWWQYYEEGTYPDYLDITNTGDNCATVMVPSNATSGQIVSIIAQGTDNGYFPLTRYARVFIQVK
jgi:hypothetical protein